MCGFTGLWRFNRAVEETDREWVLNHLRKMVYRGPDESRINDGQEGLLLGFNRLAIRDLSPLGSQPFLSASEKTLACYNGETYNIDELIELAELDRSKLKGHSDTEVLVECAEKYSLNWVLQHADGIFAIALFDRDKNTLELARDHLGIKPLYFGWKDDICVFSSEYNPIVSHQSFREGAINPNALQGYFQFGFIQEGEGLIENTMFVPQGYVIRVESSGKWSLNSYEDGIRSLRKNLLKSDIDSILAETVKEQLASEVPLGAFVSGGVDSNLIANYASTSTSRPLGAYTISVDDGHLDESDAAKELVSLMQRPVKHKVTKVKDQAVLQSMDWLEESMGEPLSDFSSLLMLQVCYEAKKDITVALSGDGGDELFFGYPRFRSAHKLKDFFKKGKSARLFSILLSRLSAYPLPINLMCYKGFLDYYLSKQGITGNERALPLILNNVDQSYRPLHFKNLRNKNSDLQDMDLARLLEFRIHLQRVLLKVDRASMFHSVEVRVPLLSKKALALSGLFEAEECIDDQNLKKPLKNLLLSKLNERAKDIVYGKKKGFEPPLGAWLKTDLKDRVAKRIFEVPISLQPFINQNGIQRIWWEHQRGERNNSDVIWALYSLFTWTAKNISNAA
ncbi:asparagine synthase (glutamine-hydrolyzing) [Schleiferiaceae bacterium]|nr:asparagine synthase (glutamine-hydrolyzing) [Schleiferiaceae bacterium]